MHKKLTSKEFISSILWVNESNSCLTLICDESSTLIKFWTLPLSDCFNKNETEKGFIIIDKSLDPLIDFIHFWYFEMM